MATRRGYFLGELDRSVKNIEMALTHLDRVAEAYKDPYPEVAVLVLQICEALVGLAKMLTELRERI